MRGAVGGHARCLALGERNSEPNAMDNTTTLIIIVAAAVVSIVIIAVLVAHRRARLRSAELQEQFGPEYDRAVDELGSAKVAERELYTRARRVQEFHFHELNAAERARFSGRWNRVQAQFVDDPAVAVSAADELIKEVMRARGYPTDDFEQRVADLSVDHPTVIQHYRAARALSESIRNGQINTEELRQAVVHYRVLFSELLEEPGIDERGLRGAHA
jgi:hypothetical protein